MSPLSFSSVLSSLNTCYSLGLWVYALYLFNQKISINFIECESQEKNKYLRNNWAQGPKGVKTLLQR